MAGFTFLKKAEYEAVGGPASPVMGKDGHMRTPTRAGRYVVHSIGKHVSYGNYAFYSGVAWGTPLRVSNGKIQIKQNNTWINLTTVPAFKNYADKDIIDLLAKFYAKQKAVLDKFPGALSAAEKKATLPNSWIFNDFGHVSVKYFKDLNNDFKLNGKEQIMGDFIHTTPVDEFIVDHNYTPVLDESHGCVHVKPKDIETFITSGYVKKGSVIEVKPYTDIGPVPISFENPAGRPEYEMHFYPGLKKLIIYTVSAI